MRYPVHVHNEARKIKLPALDVCAAYRNGWTVVEIAALYGVSVQPIKRILKEAHEPMRKPARRVGKGIGPENPAWRGGRRIRTDGYVMVWTPAGERLEHQVVMERVLGRSLTDGEVIHHKDGNKQNNSPENLELTTQSEHMRMHMPELHKAREQKRRAISGEGNS